MTATGMHTCAVRPLSHMVRLRLPPEKLQEADRVESSQETIEDRAAQFSETRHAALDQLYSAALRMTRNPTDAETSSRRRSPKRRIVPPVQGTNLKAWLTGSSPTYQLLPRTARAAAGRYGGREVGSLPGPPIPQWPEVC